MKVHSTFSILLSMAFLLPSTMAQFREVAALGGDSVSGFRFVSSFTADSSGFHAATYSGGLYRSTDGGANWNLVNREIGRKGILSLLTKGTNLYIGTSGSGIYRSNDQGATAVPINNGLLLPINICSMASTDSNLYAGTYGQGIFRSDIRNELWCWTPTPGLILSMAAKDSKVFAASNEGGVYRSLDDGLSWTFADSGLSNWHIAAVAFDGRRVYAASNGYGIIDEFPKISATIGYEVFVSTDNGDTWTVAFDNSFSQRVICFTFLGGSSGDSLIAVGSPGGIFVATNPGTTWTNISAGLPSELITAIAVHGSYLFAGTYSGRVLRRPISEILTSVTHSNDGRAMDFFLSQNYPNPFNSVTRMRLRSPASSFGSVKVYDLLGREVLTLLSQELHPGSYDLILDASGLPSGIYYCRLLVGDFNRTIKLVLQK